MYISVNYLKFELNPANPSFRASLVMFNGSLKTFPNHTKIKVMVTYSSFLLVAFILNIIALEGNLENVGRQELGKGINQSPLPRL